MDAILLARLQFALTVGFHFLFPPTTLALSLVIVVLETRRLRKIERDSVLHLELSRFLVRLLALVFVLGTATGIVMEFSFGNNWAEYSRLVGDIFGAPLAAEGIFAFFLESVFLGILVFARQKVSPRAYWWSAVAVCAGAHLSGLWIIIANSWMQTPDGFAMVAGRAVLIDFWRAAFNHSTLIRFLHTVLASWITGALLLAAIAAFWLLKGRFRGHGLALMRISLTLFAFASLLQLGSGHAHSLQVARQQPVKMAAFEALWDTRPQAPVALWAIPDAKNERNRFFVGIPGLLSFLIHGRTGTPVKGLKEFPKAERPPLALTFFSYHVMFLLGFLFIAFSWSGFFLLIKRRIENARWYLTALLFGAPLGYLACETGWIAAEVGRQPWAVYGILRTTQAASTVVSAGEVLFSLLLFTCLYALLLVLFLKILFKIIRLGPTAVEATGY